MRFLVSGIFWLLSSFAVAAESDLDLLNSMDQGREWGAVGRLSLDNGNGFCTATLIADDIVLTAGHCVYDKATGALADLTSFEFQASWRNGRAESYRGIREIAVHSQYQFAEEASIERIQFDVALLRLETPIRNPNVTPMSLTELPKNWQRHRSCFIRQRSDGGSICSKPLPRSRTAKQCTGHDLRRGLWCVWFPSVRNDK